MSHRVRAAAVFCACCVFVSLACVQMHLLRFSFTAIYLFFVFISSLAFFFKELATCTRTAIATHAWTWTFRAVRCVLEDVPRMSQACARVVKTLSVTPCDGVGQVFRFARALSTAVRDAVRTALVKGTPMLECVASVLGTLRNRDDADAMVNEPTAGFVDAVIAQVPVRGSICLVWSVLFCVVLFRLIFVFSQSSSSTLHAGRSAVDGDDQAAARRRRHAVTARRACSSNAGRERAQRRAPAVRTAVPHRHVAQHHPRSRRPHSALPCAAASAESSYRVGE